MKKNLIKLHSFAMLLLLLVACSQNHQKSNDTIAKLSKQERMQEALEHERDKTIDPELGRVPYEELEKAERYYVTNQELKSKTTTPLANIQWQQRGPNNVGGRTRAILFLTSTKVLAAGVTGGLWTTDDITATPPTWVPIGDFLSDRINISCIAQDPNDTSTIYAGTGEAFGSSHRGSGIYKSTNTGETWTKLASTTAGNSNDFTYVAKIIVASNGDVYAACKSNFCNAGGLMRSTNGGTSWSRVVGTFSGGGCANAVDFVGCDVEENEAGDLFYSTGNSSSNGHVLISNKATHGNNVGDAANWTDITPSGTWRRIEMGVSDRTNSGVIYVACQGQSSNDVQGIYYSSDKGDSWTSRTVPTICDQGSNSVYTRNQAWYDLVVEVDPSDDDVAYFGGIDLMKTTDNGASFSQVSTWSNFWPSTYGCNCCSGSAPPNVHADQHALVFNPFVANAAISGNDGGLYYSTTMNNSIPSWSDKDNGYITSQFYHLATHPTDADYIIGGTQDNGTWKIDDEATASGASVSGGDGAFCHINQADPTYQISAYVYNSFFRSTNNGLSFPSLSSTNANTGRFINPSELDDTNHILFSAGNNNILEVRSGIDSTTVVRNTYNLGFNSRRLSALRVSPNNATTLYVGDDGGNVYKITSRAGVPVKSATWNVGASGYISSIDVWKNSSNTDDSILVTLSNYGINSVYVTGNGTAATPTWVDIDDNNTLQNMPVRWGIFSQEGPDKIFIATDLGVLATDNINGNSTPWTLVNNNILPSVRTDALQYDANGNLVAATHGRGIWESKEPCNSSTASIPSSAGTYTSTKAVLDGTDLCFCDANDNLLLVLDTNGTGAVIQSNGVSLQIGATTTSSYNNAGGIISNTDGGVIMNRKWNVNASTQPSSPVTVKSYFTDTEYTDVVTGLANLTSPSIVTNPNQLEMYKLTNGGVFADPHGSGITGIVLGHSNTASVNTWVYSPFNDNHSAEFQVNSFSGGGAGGGGSGVPLPVDIIQFEASKVHFDGMLEWTTASEVNNRGFEVQRSTDGTNYETIAWIEGEGTSSMRVKYNYDDRQVGLSHTKVFYRLKQVDLNGSYKLTDARVVSFDRTAELSLYPNPTKGLANIMYEGMINSIEIYSASGTMVGSTVRARAIDMSSFENGVYFILIETDNGREIQKIIKE